MKKFAGFTIAIMFVAAVVAIPGVTATETTDTDYSTMTVTELVAIIKDLKAQIALLNSQVGGAPCFVSDKTLSLGDGETGDGMTNDVVLLQAFLREKGFFTFSKNTGFFGKITRTALMTFQGSVGVPQTGDFDAATRAKAHGMLCKVKVKTETAKATANETKKGETEKKASSPVSTVSSITASANGASVTWSVVGNSPQGFKVVWSKNSGPTYPTRDGDTYNYLPDSSATSSSLNAFDGAGTYHVRVCEYLGGACGVYSNELTVSL